MPKDHSHGPTVSDHGQEKGHQENYWTNRIAKLKRQTFDSDALEALTVQIGARGSANAVASEPSPKRRKPPVAPLVAAVAASPGARRLTRWLKNICRRLRLL